MITDRINNNLSALFNSEDEVYRALISDKYGTIPETITKPTDIDTGVIASQIRYLRRLSVNYVEQMFIDEASHEFLKYILNNFFDSLQLEDESDAQWVQRVIATIFSQKVSRAMIIFSLRPFSSQEPEITNVLSESAFADFSYADVYTSGKTTLGDEIILYLAAVAEDYESAFFTIKVTLYNTLSSDIYTVQDILDKIIAAGISVILQINYDV